MKFITDEFRQPYDIDRKSPAGVCDLGDIPSKLVSKHTFPDNKESMYLENDLRKSTTLDLQFFKQTNLFKSFGIYFFTP